MAVFFMLFLFFAGIKDIAVEMKKCIQADLCEEMITYMGFPIANESKNCRAAIRNGARVRPPTPVFFVLFLEKMLH